MIFEVTSDGENWEEYDCFSAAEAAEQAAEDYDSDGDYTIAGGNSHTFAIKAKGTEEIKYFIVYGDFERVYYSSEKENKGK